MALRQLREWWLAEARNLYVGGTRRTTLPGDRSRRSHLVIRNLPDRWSIWDFRTNSGDVVFKDHVVPYAPPEASGDISLPKDMVRLGECPAYVVRAVTSYLVSKGASQLFLPELFYSEERSRVLFKVGRTFLGRDLTDRHPTKWLVYGDRHLPYAGWVQGTKPVVLVEDVISMLKVDYVGGGYLDAVALMGTNLRPRLARDLMHVPKVIIMLDGDEAGYRSAPYARRNLVGGVPSEIIKLPLGKDPKDLTIQELKTCLSLI